MPACDDRATSPISDRAVRFGKATGRDRSHPDAVGLLVDARLTGVSGHAERLTALEMIEPFAKRPRAITLGADRGYDARDFVEELRTLNVRPHVARNVSKRRSAIDGRTTRHASYAAGIRARKRIEKVRRWNL